MSETKGNDGEEGAGVEIRDPAGGVRRVGLTGDRRVIGRSGEADIQLASAHVSRRHAELFRDPFGRWWIRDLGSQNGTVVNGVAGREFVLAGGDEVGIGDFGLKFLRRERAGEQTTITTKHVAVSRGAMGRMSTLKDLEAPRIAREHLTRLMALNRQLQNVAEAGERYKLLCRTMVDGEFQGKWAGVMRIGEAEEAAPELLCDPEFAAGGAEVGPLSRGLLKAVQAKREGVMAASGGGGRDGAAEIALTMTGREEGMAAVACPLEMEGGKIDLLYIMLNAKYATGEWLALVSLAAEEFRHAEAAHRARERAAAQVALERELKSARNLQMSLIPRGFVHAGLDLNIGFTPCRWVGGDYVDVVAMGDGRILLAVADVCGKGLPAALLASRVHTGVHTNLTAGMSLAQMMTNLNGYLYKTIPAESFVTMAVLAIEVGTGEIEFVNAGHLPAVVVKAGEKVGRVFPAGENFPLGLEPGALVAERGKLEVGEMLALYTDGLTELTDEAGGMLGIQGLEGILKEICGAGMSCAAVGEGLTRRLGEILGDGLPQDDKAFLLVRRV